LAFAAGAGLPPDRLWAELATALGTRVVTEQDVRWLVHESAAAALLEKSGAEAAARFHLFHEALAEHLRITCPHEQPDAAIAAVLLGGIITDHDRAEAWEVHPYAREHVATYLARCGQLDEWLLDGRFLRSVAAGPLLRALSSVTSVRARQAAGVYREVTLLLQENPQWSSSYLELYARQQGHTALADSWGRAEAGRTWAVPWAQCRSAEPHQVVGRHPVEITALSTLSYRAGLLIIAGDWHGAVSGWDLATSAPVFETLQLPEGVVNALVAIERRDGFVMMIGTDRGLYRVTYDHLWALVDIERLDSGAVTSLTLLPGPEDAVATGDRTGGLRIWSPHSSRLLGTHDAAHPQGVSALAGCQIDGTTLLLSAGFDGSVSTWEVCRGAVAHWLTWRGAGSPRAVALRSGDGTAPQIMAVGEDAVIRSWPLAPGRQQVTVLSAGEHAGCAVAVARAWDQPVVLTGGFLGEITIWDSIDSTRLWGPVSGHLGVVSALTSGRTGQADWLVSGGEDGYLRAWDLNAAHSPVRQPAGHAGEVTDAVVIKTAERYAVVSSGADGVIQIVDPDNGTVQDVWDAPCGGIRCLATISFPDRPMLLAGGLDGTLTAWEPAGRLLTDHPVQAHSRVLRAIGTARISDRNIVITGGDDGIRMWDRAGWKLTATPLDCDVRTLCTVNIDGRPVLACGGDDGLRLWDLSGRRPIAGPLTPWQQCRALTVVHIRGKPMVVSGGDAGVQFWDPSDGSPSGGPIAADQEIFTVTTARLAERPVLLWGDHQGIGIWSIERQREVVRINLGFGIRHIVSCGPDAVVVVALHGVFRLDLNLNTDTDRPPVLNQRPVTLREQR
jgi:WD40 repeat protein